MDDYVQEYCSIDPATVSATSTTRGIPVGRRLTALDRRFRGAGPSPDALRSPPGGGGPPEGQRGQGAVDRVARSRTAWGHKRSVIAFVGPILSESTICPLYVYSGHRTERRGRIDLDRDVPWVLPRPSRRFTP